MLSLIIFSSILLVAHGSCSSGFDLIRNGQCRGLYGTYTLVSFSDTTKNAIQHCNEIDGLPVIIHDEEDQTYWLAQKNIVANEDNNVMAIGLVCNTNSKQWEWADGSTVDYKPAE